MSWVRIKAAAQRFQLPPRLSLGERPQLRLYLEKIPPRQLLVSGRSQEIGRMQRRHGWNGDAGGGRVDTPVAAQPQNAFRGVEQRLGRWSTEIDQHLGID